MTTKPKTVLQLYKELDKAIKEGHGGKFVYTADDVEGNGYHGIYYGLETDEKEIRMLDDNRCIEDDLIAYSDVVIIG